MRNGQENIENILDFVNQDSNAKSEIQKCIKYLTREVNKNKYDYNQLRYIFRVVREKCDIEVVENKKVLLELPTKDALSEFYSKINNPTHKLIFEFLQSTGLRVSELCNLEVKSIRFDENIVFIKEGKGKKDRTVPIGNKLKQKIELYLDIKKNRYLFESTRNSKFSTRRIEQICRKYLELSEIEYRITPHTFRHLYFTFLAEHNVSKENRMLIAGHSNQKTQDIYTHLTLGHIKDEIIAILDE